MALNDLSPLVDTSINHAVDMLGITEIPASCDELFSEQEKSDSPQEK